MGTSQKLERGLFFENENIITWNDWHGKGVVRMSQEAEEEETEISLYVNREISPASPESKPESLKGYYSPSGVLSNVSHQLYGSCESLGGPHIIN